MALYESVFIARQDISSAQVDSLADLFSGLIQENGGEVKKKEFWGLRNLAYRIKKNRKGHYVLFNIDAPSSAIQEMERNMRINEDVIRYLTVRVDELEEEQSIILRSRGSRDGGRGGRDGGRGGRDGGRWGRDGGRGGRDGGRGGRDGDRGGRHGGGRADEASRDQDQTKGAKADSPKDDDGPPKDDATASTPKDDATASKGDSE